MKRVFNLLLLIMFFCLISIFTSCTGLPNIRLTENMTTDELKTTLTEVQNFKCTVKEKWHLEEMYCGETGYIRVRYEYDESMQNSSFSHAEDCFYNGLSLYDLEIDADGDYYYSISIVDKDEVILNYANQQITEVFNVHEEIDYKIDRGELLLGDETISEFNNIDLFEIASKYFPNYNKLGVGIFNPMDKQIKDNLVNLQFYVEKIYRIDAAYSTSWATTNAGTKKGLCAFLQENVMFTGGLDNFVDFTIIENATISCNTKPENENLVIWCDTDTDLKDPNGGASDTKFTIYVANEYYKGSITFEKDEITINDIEKW